MPNIAFQNKLLEGNNANIEVLDDQQLSSYSLMQIGIISDVEHKRFWKKVLF